MDGAETIGPAGVGEEAGLWACVAANAVAGALNQGLM
jgi:hypothetical protein